MVQVGLALERASPMRRIANRRQRLDDQWGRLVKSQAVNLQVRRRRLDTLTRQIDALNPLSILERGYALLTDAESGEVVASVAGATRGRRLTARVKDGLFPAIVGKQP